MTLEGPHYKNYDWTTVTAGASGGKLTTVEIDASKREQAAERLTKVLGILGRTGSSIADITDRMPEGQEHLESYIMKVLAESKLDVVFAMPEGQAERMTESKGAKGKGGKALKGAGNGGSKKVKLGDLTNMEDEGEPAEQQTDVSPEARPSGGKKTDSGTAAEAGRDMGTAKSVATTANAADENPEEILEKDATTSGRVAAAEEPEEQEREDDEEGDDDDGKKKASSGKKKASSNAKSGKKGRK